MSSDIFSLRGLQNIEVAIGGWKKGLKRGLEIYEDDNNIPFQTDDGKAFSTPSLKFIGYVTQQYTAKTVAGKKQPVDAYEKIIRKIAPSIKKHLVDSLNDGLQLNYKLGEIPYFHSLVPMAQTSNKPIFHLKSSDGIVGAHFDKVKQFDGVISSICEQLLKNVRETENG